MFQIQKHLDNDVTTYGYSTSRQLIQATNIIGTVNITYDSTGAPIQITYPNGHTIGYSYYNGQRTSMSIDDGYNITYQYDTSGTHITQINLSNGTDTPLMLAQFSYYTSGKIQRKTLGNLQYTTYKYMALKSRLSEMNTYTSNDHLLSSYIYQYDEDGRVVSVTTLSGTFNYSYDGIGQLTGFTNPNGETTFFTYDGNGNRVSQVTNGVKATYIANAMNQYLQYNETDSFVFDQNGNLNQKTTTDGTQYFNFNSESKLTETQRGTLRCNYLFHYSYIEILLYLFTVAPINMMQWEIFSGKIVQTSLSMIMSSIHLAAQDLISFLRWVLFISVIHTKQCVQFMLLLRVSMVNQLTLFTAQPLAW